MLILGALLLIIHVYWVCKKNNRRWWVVIVPIYFAVTAKSYIAAVTQFNYHGGVDCNVPFIINSYTVFGYSLLVWSIVFFSIKWLEFRGNNGTKI